jgi:hypothetical protein
MKSSGILSWTRWLPPHLQLLRKVLQVGFLPVVMADGNPIAIAVNIDELVAERLSVLPLR